MTKMNYVAIIAADGSLELARNESGMRGNGLLVGNVCKAGTVGLIFGQIAKDALPKQTTERNNAIVYKI